MCKHISGSARSIGNITLTHFAYSFCFMNQLDAIVNSLFKAEILPHFRLVFCWHIFDLTTRHFELECHSCNVESKNNFCILQVKFRINTQTKERLTYEKLIWAILEVISVSFLNFFPINWYKPNINYRPYRPISVFFGTDRRTKPNRK